MSTVGSSSDFKVVAFLTGLRSDLTKCPCCLDLLVSRHLSALTQQAELSVERNNVKWAPLVGPQRVMMPPMYTKLGLMKHLTTSLGEESSRQPSGTFNIASLSCLSDLSKTPALKGHSWRRCMTTNEEYPAVQRILHKLTRKEKAACNSCVAAVWRGSHWVENYVDSGEELGHEGLQDILHSRYL